MLDLLEGIFDASTHDFTAPEELKELPSAFRFEEGGANWFEIDAEGVIFYRQVMLGRSPTVRDAFVRAAWQDAFGLSAPIPVGGLCVYEIDESDPAIDFVMAGPGGQAVRLVITPEFAAYGGEPLRGGLFGPVEDYRPPTGSNLTNRDLFDQLERWATASCN